MKQAFRTFPKFLLGVFPIVAACVTSALPAQAATLAVSTADAIFANFNLFPDSTSTVTDTTAIATSFGGNAASFADATALFQVNPPVATNTSISQASGSFGSYLGLANSQARVLGRFFVTDWLQFDFQTHLNLGVAIDDPTLENARASGALFISVINSTDPAQLSLLDFFSIAGNLDTALPLTTPQGEASPQFTLAGSLALNTVPDGTSQSIKTAISGSYQRKFAQPTYITLIERKENQVAVQAIPEPSGISLGCGAVIAYGLRLLSKRRLKNGAIAD